MSRKAPDKPYPVTHFAIVTADLDAKVRSLHETFGWGPWMLFDLAAPTHRGEIGGRPAEYSAKVAFWNAKPMAVEVVQPVDGQSFYADFLREHGEGIHHVMVRRPDEDPDADEPLLEFDFPVLAEGSLGNGLTYKYWDTIPDLGMLVETSRIEDESWSEPLNIRYYPEQG